MIDIISVAIAAFASGYAMCHVATMKLRGDAWRWQAIDRLRNSGSEAQRVTIWSDDKAGRALVSTYLYEYRAASIDVCLAQALHTIDAE